MPNDTLAKSIVAKTLGALWILDGLLQLQPAMFGQAFVSNILTPLLSGQPAFLQAIVALGIHAWSANTIIANTLAALLQLSIGILLFFPPTDRRFKIGAYISIGWSIIVWLCGEGAGLLLTGTASLYAGAPGAVLFYALIAAFLLMPEKISAKAYPKIVGWTLLFGAALQLQPLFWTADGSQQVAMASSMEPVSALAAVPTYLSNLIASHAAVSNVLLIALPLLLGLALLFKPNRVTGVPVLVFLFLAWWIGQDFGQLTSIFYNTPTDPQLSPLLALCLAPLFITRDMTTDNKHKYDTGLIIAGTLSGILLLGIVMYGVVVTTLQHTSPAVVPTQMQMHMSS